MRNSREVAFLKGATGSCRWWLHYCISDSSQDKVHDGPLLDSIQRMSGQGLAGFIQKPYSLKNLREAFEKAGVAGR